METEQLYANGNPVCPTTNYENDNAAQRIRNAEILLDEIAERVATRLLEKTDIAEWAKQARKPSYTASEVGADASGSAQRALLDAKEYSDSTYQQATGYTDTAIARLVGSAPSTLDTLGEIAAAMEDNESVVLALEAAIGNKADEKEYQAHAGNRTMHVTASEREKWNEAADRIPSAPEDIGALPSGASAVSADKWKTPRNINGMNVDGSGNRTNYGTCSTAAATAAKVVSCNGFGLVTGAEITVKFTVTNTAANPTLNVNSTGAKPVWYRGAAIAAGYLAANRTYMFRYNGTQYELVGDIDTNEKYAAMTGATESAGGKAGLVPAPAKGAQGKYLRGDGTWVAPATTLAGTVQGIPLDQTMGKILNDKVSEIISNLTPVQIGLDFISGMTTDYGVLVDSLSVKQGKMIQFQFGITFSRNVPVNNTVTLSGLKYPPINTLFITSRGFSIEMYLNGKVNIQNISALPWSSGETKYFNGVYMTNI